MNPDSGLSIASDDSRQIPFTIIGILLLVSSTTLVFYLDTRPESGSITTTVSPMDRASASAKTAVSDGISEGLQKTAAEPLNRTADTPVGRAIDEADVRIEGEESTYETFGPYVRLRIYQETQRNLDRGSQRINESTVTRASLPALSNEEDEIAAAISKVDLEVGRYQDDMESGAVRATVSGINVSVVRNGTVVDNKTETITVTTGSAVFGLHERTTTYEKRLNTDFFDTSVADAEGFSQKFAKRLYPLVWSKAYTERMHPNARPSEQATAETKFAFHSLVENHEAETVANAAIFSVQQRVFGSKDPQAEAVMSPAWACVGARTIETLADADGRGQAGGGTPSEPTTERTAAATASASTTGPFMTRGGAGFNYSFSDENFCQTSRFPFGEVSGPAPSNLRDITDQMLGGIDRPITRRTAEIPIERFAQPAFQEVVGADQPGFSADDIEGAAIEENATEAGNHPAVDSNYANGPNQNPSYGFTPTELVDTTINSTYRVDVSAGLENTSSSGSLPDADEPDRHSGWRSVATETTQDSVDTSVNWTELPNGDSQQRLHEITVSLDIEYTEVEKWVRTEDNVRHTATTNASSSKRYQTTIVIEGGFAPGHDVEDRDIANMYRANGAPGPTENFNPGLDASISELLDGVEPDTLESDIENETLNASAIRQRSDFTDQIEDSLGDPSTIGPETLLAGNRSALESWMVSQLQTSHDGIVDDVNNTTVTRRRILTGEEPLSVMRSDLDAVDDDYVYPNSTFLTPAHYARAELVNDYVDNTNDWMTRYVEKRNSGREQINQQLGPDGERINEGFSQALFFAREALSVSSITETRAKVEETPLLGEISYRVDGSPTYLSSSPVTRTSTPDARPARDGPDTPNASEHAALAVRNDVWLPVPGLPLVPWPEFWFVSANTVTLDVEGEYARFEVTADTTKRGRTSTYRRQDEPVTMEIAQQERRVGTVDPVNFTSRTDIVVATPGPVWYPNGSYGPGDRVGNGTDHRLVECTAAWGATGPSFDLSAVDYDDCPNLPSASSNTYRYLNRTADGDITVEETG
ncbi:hypothetical protein EGH22_01760 [Halomicroarcula sp. F28]|uniref:DUF7286 family protein n=1 Tax=Haloarcula salinisoli TaxID=2487746 RepID=UPI001C73028E|nr:hypothetical protein [Halomicroarcula salinisoli]MBX0285040.1 hypothetical protein [Halomicroarcula salinisoli]